MRYRCQSAIDKRLFQNEGIFPLTLPYFRPLQNSFCNGFKGDPFAAVPPCKAHAGECCACRRSGLGPGALLGARHLSLLLLDWERL